MPIEFSGVFPIVATPYNADESLDLDSLDRLIRFLARLGVDGVTILGVLGEANRMLDHEREQVIRTTIAAAGGLPVVVGTSHPGTRATRELSLLAHELGAAAVMITPSREPVPDDGRIFDYFQRVAEALPLPIVVQDHPASTQVFMGIPLLARLATEIPQVACIKEEGVPTPVRIEALRRATAERRLPILTGLGALYGIFDLRSGSDGFMTGFAFPEVLQALVRLAREGRWPEAAALYRRFLPLIVFEQQPGVAVRKELLRHRGLIAHSQVRHPGASLAPGAARQLESLLKETLPGVDLTQPLVAY